MYESQTVMEPAQPRTSVRPSRERGSGKLFMQYGCGLRAPSSWTNFDASPSLVAQRIPVIGGLLRRMLKAPQFPSAANYGDIVKGLALASESCSAVYCSHVLEHLSLNDCRKALQNTWTYLEEGGVFRFVLPDLECLAMAYVRNTDAQAAHRFMRDSLLGCEQRRRGLNGLLRSWLGNSEHLWMWDYKAMATELSAVGFREIRRAAMGDSDLPEFLEVEESSRWEGCLGIECRR